MNSLRRCLSVLTVAAVAATSGPAHAQQEGGRAGTLMRTAQSARDVSLGGLMPVFGADASAIMSLGAALAWIERPMITASWSSPLFGVIGSASLAAAVPAAGAGGFGLALTTRSTGEQRAYDAARRPSGTITDRELALSVGGALAIGPGSVGATIHLLRRDVSGAGLSNTGYSIDLGGTIAFDQRLFFGLALRDIAGEVVSGESTLREAIPWQAQIVAAYVSPLERWTSVVRPDPTGVPVSQPSRPRSYVLGMLGARYVQGDTLPGVTVGGEAVPISSVPVGFRLGLNSFGEIAGGFFYRLAVDAATELRLDYGVRWFDAPSDVTHHVSLSATF